MPYIIGPGFDLLLGLACGTAFYLTATGTWWTVPELWRRATS